MNCTDLTNDLLLEAILEPGSRDPELLAHTEGCPACRERVEGIRRLVDAIRSPKGLGNDVPIPETADAAILALARQTPPAPRPAPRWTVSRLWAPVAAAAVLLVAIGVEYFSPPPPDPPSGPDVSVLPREIPPSNAEALGYRATDPLDLDGDGRVGLGDALVALKGDLGMEGGKGGAPEMALVLQRIVEAPE